MGIKILRDPQVLCDRLFKTFELFLRFRRTDSHTSTVADRHTHTHTQMDSCLPDEGSMIGKKWEKLEIRERGTREVMREVMRFYFNSAASSARRRC